MALLRQQAGIANPAYYSEWGGPAAIRYAKSHADDPAAPSYFQWFDRLVVQADPVPLAGGNYFTLVATPKFPLQGLVTGPSASPAYETTPLGRAFIAAYLGKD